MSDQHHRELESLPQELKASCRWVSFRLEDAQPKDGKPGRERCKVPKNSRDPKHNASSTDPESWSTFEEAIASLSTIKPFLKYADDPYPVGIGLVFGVPFFGVDLDDCVDGGEVAAWAVELLRKFPATYTEYSPSKKGLHLWWKCAEHAKLPDGIRTDQAEAYSRKRYFTMTGEHAIGVPSFKPEVTEVSLGEARAIFDAIDALKNGERTARTTGTTEVSAKLADLMNRTDFPDLSQAVQSLLTKLGVETVCDPVLMEARFKESKLYTETHWCEKWERLKDSEIAKAIGFARENLSKRLQKHKPEIDPDSWRDSCKTVAQLRNEPPKFLIGAPPGLPPSAGLVPEKALTLNVAPSYHGKSWFSLQEADAMATGKPLWCFPGPGEPVPVIYHVPEMDEARVRYYAETIGIAESENFLIRAMESGLWALDDARMLKSSEGRVVFLDTAGYFNPADDTNAYNQALRFATMVYNLLNVGALAVVGLYHLSKESARNKEEWSLENSVIGSVGYGGILRSCVRLENLKEDKNDLSPWLYVQGLKNPGLKPFQLEGVPLSMKVAPGNSPYRRNLVGNSIDPQEVLARQCARESVGVNETERRLKKEFGKKAWSHGKVSSKYNEFVSEENQDAEPIPF